MRLLHDDEIAEAQAILSAGIVSADRYLIHPGELAWWVHHHDRRHPQPEVWLGDAAVVVLDTGRNQIDVFATDTADPVSLIEWSQERFGGSGTVGGVADDDREVVDYLQMAGYAPVSAYRSYRWDLSQEVPSSSMPDGWVLRSVNGEEEADNRRAASHAAFESTMDPVMHLERYLEFMRSPVYDRDRDLVAVAPDGRIASFMVWWPDASGVSQIEPFGTHPDFQRLGAGRALMNHGLGLMKQAGMRVCRVVTDDYRAATSFYESVGFVDVGALRWWAKQVQ